MNKFSQVYVVGDIHGCIILLKNIQKKIIKIAKKNNGVKLLIYLGDYIDRGSNIKETIQTLIDFNPKNFKRVFLLGNHEQMMLDYINSEPNSLYLWLMNGGDKTLNSYGIKNKIIFNDINTNDKILRNNFINKIPKEHLSFFNNLSLYYEWNNYFFVHAGIDPDLPLYKQDKNTLIWTRNNKFLNKSRIFEKIIVHGHTPIFEIENLNYRINIDTGAFYSNILSCLLIDTKTGNRKFLNSKK